MPNFVHSFVVRTQQHIISLMYFWPRVRIFDRLDGAAEKELTPTDRRRVKFPLVPIPREQHTSSFRLAFLVSPPPSHVEFTAVG
jgi:hypothetical protein